MIERLVEQGIGNKAVLNIIRGTPRHIFLDEALSHRAYEDSSLPIGFQQTLSRPYIVARMTELLLANGPRERVLEVGTGSGYQTAILAQMVARVFSVERIRPLQEKARHRLRQLGLHNVHLRHADGGMGWKDRGPFDAILSAAAPAEVPQDLLDQLAIGGRLVIPVGPQGKQQSLYVYDKTEDGIEEQMIEPVLFVPLVAGVLS
jgi:protein-L-isoaspartate(D-aspartate) O-methyltransferase